MARSNPFGFVDTVPALERRLLPRDHPRSLIAGTGN
jgi:hypothetical protein